MSSNKKWTLKNIITANGSCKCGSNSKANVIEPKPKSDQNPTHYLSFSASSGGGTVSPSCPKLRNSFAIVKDSDDPYQDFRRSMLQMIFEKEIYSRNDLQQLLDCFLQLNSPQYHEVIVRAFMEIWNGGAAGEAASPP